MDFMIEGEQAFGYRAHHKLNKIRYSTHSVAGFSLSASTP